MAMPEELKIHLDEIAERLWSGHASVMVGAGFSKNTIENSPSSKPFLNWHQLSNIFFEKLHGREPSTKENYLNPLKLAEEFCAAFGRPVLEKLLQTSLPDLEHSPSDLHKKLLELQWNDVFTTNYDTLLERTKVSQKYDVVLNKTDLVFSQRPRIIKLHGSFPSTRPFIITEEDYRTYPVSYAPFVNTVQQSLIENALCLVGFSGDDPNFLNWIGWIRDNLGTNSPKLFLIGAFRFSSTQIKVLHQRNITVIDLSPLAAEGPEQYKKSLERFLDYLHQKKKDEVRLDWPLPQEKREYAPSYSAKNEEKVEAVGKAVVAWRASRERYPGWIICPSDCRQTLWRNTENWLGGKHLKIELPESLDIEFWYEFVWRLEKSLSPIYDDMVFDIEIVVNKYSSHLESGKHTNVQNLKSKWSFLLLSLLRYFREEGLVNKWETYASILREKEPFTAQENDIFQYEVCLAYLFRQDLLALKSSIRSWQPNDSSPFAQSRKAGLLAELGELDEAEEIIEKALQLVRSQLNLQPITSDYSLISQEAYILQLTNFIKDAKGSFKKEEEKSHREEAHLRWDRIKQYKCDPWGELRLFEAELTQPFEELVSRKRIDGFDIGYSSTTHYLALANRAAQAGFFFLRYLDDTGIPLRIKNMTMAVESAKGAIERIGKYSPNWATVSLFRAGNSKDVDILYDREKLAGVTTVKIDNLVDAQLKLIRDLTEDIESVDHWRDQNIGTSYAGIIPEVLSRLATRCSSAKLNELLEFIVNVYKSPHRDKYREINHLWSDPRFIGHG